MTIKYHYEYRVAYIPDGSIEEFEDPTDEKYALDWLRMCESGQVEGVAPGDAFLQQRRVMANYGSWKSILN